VLDVPHIDARVTLCLHSPFTIGPWSHSLTHAPTPRASLASARNTLLVYSPPQLPAARCPLPTQSPNTSSHRDMTAFSDVVGSATSPNKLINLLRGHVSSLLLRLPRHPSSMIHPLPAQHVARLHLPPLLTAPPPDGQTRLCSPHACSTKLPILSSPMTMLLFPLFGTAPTTATCDCVNTSPRGCRRSIAPHM
jgi:hypothetical protein